jgi:hypothetical protein
MQKTFPPFLALTFKYMDDVQEVLYVRRQLREREKKENCSQILFPDWGNKVDSGIGLSYRPARLYRQAADTATLCRSQLYPPVRD